MGKDSNDILSRIIEKAAAAGADDTDAILVESRALSVRQRMGQPETIERSESRDIGIRVFIKGKKGLKQAIVSSNDLSSATISGMITRAVDMARAAPEDPFTGLAEDNLLIKNLPELDLYDAQEPSEERLKELASKAEDAAMAVKGVTNSEGAEASFGAHEIALATSAGFNGSYHTTNSSISASIIAGSGTLMETDWDYSTARYLSDLKKPEEVGKSAGERAVKKLNPKKIGSCQVPVIFDSRVAKSLLGSFAGAINGVAVAKKASFLKDSMGKKIFSPGINIIDDANIKRGISSRPFDAEGVACKHHMLVEDGVLKSWLLDSRSAKKLGLETTGHASRGTSSGLHPASTNLYMENGKASLAEMLADIKNGFYVTEAFGMGVNDVTGDYSQGASGFWIENGEITYPVSELTIAGNLKEMFLGATPANDLKMQYGTNSPTLLINKMTVAGS